MSTGALARFYKSKRWQRCRDAYMGEHHFICERCGAPALICHHKRYLTEDNYTDPEVSLNFDRLECLCQTCHNKEHAPTSATVEGLEFDGEGNLVKVRR